MTKLYFLTTSMHVLASLPRIDHTFQADTAQEKLNANGLRVLTLWSKHDLTIANTIFQQSIRLKFSWMHAQSHQWHILSII